MEFDSAGFDREVGLRLQRARKGRRITQKELARRIGLPRPSYANIESGRQRIPVDVVWRAAVVMGLPMAALVPEPLARAIESAPVFPIPAAVIPASPGSANMITAGTLMPPAESMASMRWQKSPESGDD